MKIFKIARIGTRDMTVEEAEDARAACFAAGWAPEWCEVADITDAVKRLEIAEPIPIRNGREPRARATRSAA